MKRKTKDPRWEMPGNEKSTGLRALLNQREPLGRFFIGALVLVLFYCKCVNFYLLQGNGKYSLLFAAATSLIVCAIYFVIGIFSPKAANITAITLYFIMSVIFAVSTVYFAYMHRLPSFYLLKVAGQAGDVEGAVGTLITWRNVIFLADFPLWIAYGAAAAVLKIRAGKKRPISPGSAEGNEVRRTFFPVHLPRYVHTIAVSAGTVLVALFLVLGICLTNFKVSFLKNEVFVFYARDVYNLIGGNSGQVDRSQYLNAHSGDERFDGLAEGMNLVVIQVEALQSFVINNEYKGQEITPNLNALINDNSLYFDNYYYQVGGGNTSDAEFTVNNSLYSTEEGGSYDRYPDNDYYGLPWLLKDRGYTTAAFHGNTGSFWNREEAYVKQGFDMFYSSEDMDPDSELHEYAAKGGISDRSMFTQAAEVLSDFNSPFYAFIITLSTHNPFSLPPHERAIDADNSSPDLVTLYVQAANYFDTVLGEFIEDLKARGLYDNTMFVIYGDHYAISGELPNGDYYISEVSDKILDRPFTLFDSFSVPLIIHIPGMNYADTVHTVGGHVDVLPTLLNLYGIENDKAVMFGHDLLDSDYDGVVYEMMHTKIGSFITDNIFYQVTNTHPSVYTKDGTDPGDPEQYAGQSAAAEKTITDCQALLERNEVLLENENTDESSIHTAVVILSTLAVILIAAVIIVVHIRKKQRRAFPS